MKVHVACAAALGAAVLAPSGETVAQTLPSPDDAPWIQTVRSPYYFAVMVTDVDRAVEWYSEVFGLQPVGDREATDGSWRIVNLRSELLYVEVIRDDRAEMAERALGFRKVGFFVLNVHEIADRVERTTGERPRVVAFAELGLQLIQLEDPEGNTIQISSHLP